MTDRPPLAALFPGAVPADAGLAAPVVQDRYLCGGTLRPWGGPHEDVISPVWEPAPLRPRVIGRGGSRL